MSSGELLWWVLFILWNLLLAASDWRRRKVPNVLVVAAACLQILWAGAAALGMGWQYPPMWPGWLMALAGFLMALIFLPLWMLRIMGAGDVKVIGVYGLILGPAHLLVVLAIGSLVAGLHAILYLQVSRWWAISPRLRQVPYAAYLAIGALSMVSMLWNSP